jgi:hypothetical protein
MILLTYIIRSEDENVIVTWNAYGQISHLRILCSFHTSMFKYFVEVSGKTNEFNFEIKRYPLLLWRQNS